MKERVDVLRKGRWETLSAEPFFEGCLESEEVTSFSGVKGAARKMRRWGGSCNWSRVRMQWPSVMGQSGSSTSVRRWWHARRANQPEQGDSRGILPIFCGCGVEHVASCEQPPGGDVWEGGGMARCLCCWMAVRSHCWVCFMKSS